MEVFLESMTLHRLSYPSTSENMEIIWGKDYTFLSKVFNTALDWLYDNHRQRIIGNIQWYSDRFDYYNQVLNSFINLKLLFHFNVLFSYSKFVGRYFSRHTCLFLVRFLRILIEFLLSWTVRPRKCADRVDFQLYRMLCGMVIWQGKFPGWHVSIRRSFSGIPNGYNGMEGLPNSNNYMLSWLDLFPQSLHKHHHQRQILDKRLQASTRRI